MTARPASDDAAVDTDVTVEDVAPHTEDAVDDGVVAEDTELDDDAVDEDGEDDAEEGDRAEQLEHEGEIAADFLERLLDIADLDGDLDVDIEGDRASISIVDSEDGRVPRRLVGTEGKVLEALQELARMAVQAETGDRSRLMLDIAGYRAGRRTLAQEAARRTIAEVKSSGEAQPMEPMTAFERKVVHDVVVEEGLTSQSDGSEPNRYVVINPA